MSIRTMRGAFYVNNINHIFQDQSKDTTWNKLRMLCLVKTFMICFYWWVVLRMNLLSEQKVRGQQF